MASFIVVLLIFVCGVFVGRKYSLQKAREGDVVGAERVLGWTAIGTGVAAMLSLMPTAGLPFEQKESTTFQEVTTTGVRTVPDQGKSWWWPFGSRERKQEYEHTRPVRHTSSSEEVNPALLVLMGVIGIGCGMLQQRTVRWLWRWGR